MLENKHDFLKFWYNNKTLLLRLIILLIVTWFSIGFFPILNFEGDSSYLIAGCERMYNNGFKLPPDFYYEWDMQPLVGVIIVLLRYIFSFWNSEEIYSGLTALITIAYLFTASCFASKISKIRWEYIFIVFIFFPESYSVGFYPNTVIFASFISLLGFLFVLNKPFNWLSLLLLAIAPLLRIDVLAMYPLLFPLLLLNNSFKKSLIYVVYYALFIISFITVCLWLMKANPLNTLLNYNQLIDNKSRFDLESFMVVNVGYYSLCGIILLIAGFIYLIKIRNYLILLLTIIPVITLYYLYEDFVGAAPKHIQYLLPFLVLIAGYAIINFKSKSRKHKLIYLSSFLILFCVTSFVGVRFYPKSKPWLNKEYAILKPYPTLIQIATIEISHKGTLELVLGAGQILPTADELMLFSGGFFTPLYWHKMKSNEIVERKILAKLIDSSKNDTLNIMTTQSSDWVVTQQLHVAGFQIVNSCKQSLEKGFSWDGFEYYRKSDNIHIFVKTTEVERNKESFNKAFIDYKTRPLYVKSRWDWQLYFINEKMTNAIPISSQLSIVR